MKNRYILPFLLAFAVAIPAMAQVAPVPEEILEQERVAEKLRNQAQEKINNVRNEIGNTKDEVKNQIKEVKQNAANDLKAKKEELQKKWQEAKELRIQRQNEFKEQVQNKREEIKNKIQTRHEELKQKLQVIKDEKKKQIVERVDTRLNELNERAITHFSNALERLDNALAKISTRAEKAAADDGKDITEVQTAIKTAQDVISAARTAVETQSQKIYDISITNESGLKNDVGTARKALHDDLVKVRQSVFSARDAVHKAAQALYKILNIEL